MLERTALSSADISIFGKLFPLLLARCKIPTQAFGLKKYLGGRSWVSMVSDKKETAASLGHSEELRVQYSPRQTITEPIQLPEQA